MGTCVDFFVLALVGDFLPCLFTHALQDWSDNDNDGLSEQLVVTSDDADAFVQDFSWKQVACKTKNRGQASLDNAQWCFEVLLLAIRFWTKRAPSCPSTCSN